MPKGKLRRCAMCGKFHASYLVPDFDPVKKGHLCYPCWKARQAAGQPSAAGGPPPADGQLPQRRHQK